MTDMTISSDNLANRIAALPEQDQWTIYNVISGIEGRQKYFKTDYLGLLSLKFVDWFGSKDNLSDDEVDEIISSVRRKRREQSNSH